MDRIAQLVKRTRDETFVDEAARRHGRQPHARHRPRSAAPRSTTRRTTSSRSCSAAAWAWSGSKTRPASDTAPRCPVWAPAYGRGRRDASPQWDLANADCVVDHGLQHGGEPPDRLPLRHAGEGARRDGHPRRPALHPHLGAGRHLRAGPRRHRHRLPRRHHPLHPRARPLVQGVRAQLHQHRDDHRRAASRTPSELRRPVLRLGRGEPAATSTTPGSTRASTVPSSLAEHYVNTTESYSDRNKRHDRGAAAAATRRCSTRTASTRSCSGTTRAYTPEMVERVTGCPQEIFLKVADALARNSGRERTGAWSATPSAGRTTPPACR